MIKLTSSTITLHKVKVVGGIYISIWYISFNDPSKFFFKLKKFIKRMFSWWGWFSVDWKCKGPYGNLSLVSNQGMKIFVSILNICYQGFIQLSNVTTHFIFKVIFESVCRLKMDRQTHRPKTIYAPESLIWGHKNDSRIYIIYTQQDVLVNSHWMLSCDSILKVNNGQG